MGKIIDLTGQRFGKLVVVRREENSAKGKVRWLCDCGCGAKRIVSGTHLVTGHTRSCGCMRRPDIMNGFNYEDRNKKWFLYLLLSLNGDIDEVYVGITKDPLSRVTQHKDAARNQTKPQPIYEAMRKHGIDSFRFIILREYVDEVTALSDESKFIKTLGNSCCNLATYGSSVGVIRSNEQRKQHSLFMSERYKDKKNMDWWNKNIKPKFLNRSAEVERRRIEKLRTPEHRERASQQVKKHFSNHENRRKMSLAKQVRVYTTPYGVFHSSTLAAKAACVTPKCVLDRCNNKSDKFDEWVMCDLVDSD